MVVPVKASSAHRGWGGSVVAPAPFVPRAAVVPQSMTFADAFETYAPFAWNVLTLLGVAPGDVPDVCQEVFLVLHRRWNDIVADRPLKSWLYAVCARKAAEYRRHRRARPEIATAEPPEGRVDESAEAMVDRRRTARQLMQALDRLDADRRAAFVLYEIEGLSIAEVAGAVGCPLQTVYSRLRSARAVVGEAFARATQTNAAVAAPDGRER